MSEPLKFSLRLKEVPFELEDLNGVCCTYCLRELNGTDRDTFMTKMGNRTRPSADGKASILKDFNGLYAELLHMSVYDPTNTRVPIPVLQTWPASVQQELFNQAMEMSRLKEPEKPEEKNV